MRLEVALYSAAAEVSTEDHDDEETLVIDESADKKESNEDHKDSKEEEEEEEEKDFEPTIDMMINDFDDERTMEEEEALAEEDENASELILRPICGRVCSFWGVCSCRSGSSRGGGRDASGRAAEEVRIRPWRGQGQQ